MPITCNSVVIPLVKKFAATRKLVVWASSPRPLASSRSTAMVPGVMVRTCWNAITSILPLEMFPSNTRASLL